MILAVQLFKPQSETEPWKPQEAVNVEWVLVDFSDYVESNPTADLEARACTIALSADPKYDNWKLGPVIRHYDGVTVLKDPVT